MQGTQSAERLFGVESGSLGDPANRMLTMRKAAKGFSESILRGRGPLLGRGCIRRGARRRRRLLSCPDRRRDAVACVAGGAQHHRRLTFGADDLKLTPATACAAHRATTPGALDLDLIFGRSHLLLTIEGPKSSSVARDRPERIRAPARRSAHHHNHLELGEWRRPRGGAPRRLSDKLLDFADGSSQIQNAAVATMQTRSMIDRVSLAELRLVAEALTRSLKPERAKRSSPVGLSAPHSPVGTPLEAQPEPTPACLFVHICSDTSDGRAGGGLARTAATLLVSSSGPVWMREPPAPVASVARLCVTASGVVDAIHA